jgi:photosystem II stability/assembly factor-like uncharacterized protein
MVGAVGAVSFLEGKPVKTFIIRKEAKGHGKGPIQFKKSTDGGLTWSDRLPTPKNWETSLETPTIHQLNGNRLILFSGLYPIRSAISDDNGATWSPLAPIGDFGGIVAMSSVIKLKNGNYMAVFHDDGRFFQKTPAEKRAFIVYKTISTDNGQTWQKPIAIAQHTEAHLCEPGLLRSPNGKQIAMLLRENSRKFNSFVTFSDDEGQSWSTPREVPTDLTGDRHVAIYTKNKKLFITFRETVEAASARPPGACSAPRHAVPLGDARASCLRAAAPPR